MDALIESIRSALAPEASAEARAGGVAACRTILATLEPGSGETVTTTAAAPSLPIATIADALRGMPADQLIDLAITKLRAVLPAGSEPPPVAPLKFHLVPVPRGKR